MNNRYEENILYIPNLSNKKNNYNLYNIYTPRNFDNINEYIKHMENLRKLKNYDLIVKQMDILSDYKNIVNDKLNKLNWRKKIKTKMEEEHNKLNILKNPPVHKIDYVPCSEYLRYKSNLKDYNKKKIYSINNKSNINYSGLKNPNIRNSDIDKLRKELNIKVSKKRIKLPKIK
jgi:hypothetical protein